MLPAASTPVEASPLSQSAGDNRSHRKLRVRGILVLENRANRGLFKRSFSEPTGVTGRRGVIKYSKRCHRQAEACAMSGTRDAVVVLTTIVGTIAKDCENNQAIRLKSITPTQSLETLRFRVAATLHRARATHKRPSPKGYFGIPDGRCQPARSFLVTLLAI